MREHKYRAWHKAEKCMVEVTALYLQSKSVLCLTDSEHISPVWNDDEIEIMQSTGVTDCNGLDIYDSDIVRIEHTSLLIPRGTIGVINYVNARYVVDTHAHTHGLNMFVDRRYRRYGKPHIEVIGNVWEHPELAPKK